MDQDLIVSLHVESFPVRQSLAVKYVNGVKFKQFSVCVCVCVCVCVVRERERERERERKGEKGDRETERHR